MNSFHVLSLNSTQFLFMLTTQMNTELLPLKGNFLAATKDSPCPMMTPDGAVSLSSKPLMLAHPGHETSLVEPTAYAE